MIYALNTKNDEHEEEIESLKEAHEDEVRETIKKSIVRFVELLMAAHKAQRVIPKDVIIQKTFTNITGASFYRTLLQGYTVNTP